jgi:hypothetical protein
MNNGAITLQPGIGLWSDAATHSYNRKQRRLTPSQYSLFQELRAESQPGYDCWTSARSSPRRRNN